MSTRKHATEYKVHSIQLTVSHKMIENCDNNLKAKKKFDSEIPFVTMNIEIVFDGNLDFLHFYKKK